MTTELKYLPGVRVEGVHGYSSFALGEELEDQGVVTRYSLIEFYQNLYQLEQNYYIDKIARAVRIFYHISGSLENRDMKVGHIDQFPEDVNLWQNEEITGPESFEQMLNDLKSHECNSDNPMAKDLDTKKAAGLLYRCFQLFSAGEAALTLERIEETRNCMKEIVDLGLTFTLIMETYGDEDDDSEFDFMGAHGAEKALRAKVYNEAAKNGKKVRELVFLTADKKVNEAAKTSLFEFDPEELVWRRK